MKMIGTTRMPDKEQTEVLSGHLEIATITTNDSPNSINRLRSRNRCPVSKLSRRVLKTKTDVVLG